MEYDFSQLHTSHIELLEKKLVSFQKSCIKEYLLVLDVINNPAANKVKKQILVEISDILNDVANKSSNFYVEALNKIKHLLDEEIK